MRLLKVEEAVAVEPLEPSAQLVLHPPSLTVMSFSAALMFVSPTLSLTVRMAR